MALREPLLHFLLIGLGLFVLYGQVSPGDSDGHSIRIGQRQADAIVAQYQAQWNRPPSMEELRALIETQVRDEILYREGRSLGLDRDDAVIQRRVRQKYDLIAEDENTPAAPGDAVLDAWRRAHASQFTQPAVVTFDQMFFNPSTTTPAEVARVSATLARGGDARGQSSMLPAHVDATALDMVARDFGDGFAKALATAPVGRWIGPVASGYGVHLVRISTRTSPALPPLAEVRAEVLREWENDQRIRAREAGYARLRADYDVAIDASQLAGVSRAPER